MLEIYGKDMDAVCYEPIGWKSGVMVRVTSQVGGSVNHFEYTMSGATWARESKTLNATERAYRLDAVRRLWRETDSDNFHWARFHGFMVDRERVPIWVAERSAWPDDEPFREIDIEQAARNIEKQHHGLDDYVVS